MKKKNKMIKKKEKDITNIELLQSINRGFSKIEEKMVTKNEFAEVKTDVANIKTDVANIKTDVANIKTDVANIKTDFKSFRTETRESFDKLEKNLKENEESIGAVVADYHPHIIALEEKVFGSSTLAEG